uniref:Uncharacterized protein n=1 Tax=Grammatophora oceanica TaxID=210454 RepID=A0A6U5PAN6_9STRA|mmetsp:Transcript_5167/g.7190  ORF Transcript_5167/g.7190 Transcript_5167/m.7190 type:complete len:213 (+) Transcript_5167:78-716(+)|eukprot:CAMPEP_0194033786 /NCGR_PEP_ID=MMETSP0009_2-20130614/6327_1 /TAXON_ID=210454 /ORGANISM="Grammatophora oceanica, Strain CCMP 410" /LENGTH=212 /DNA_ID=CAMNT_0038674511 /DNA_START=41 /DNA_END=679 /DNA_ORIENTATION=+
MKFITSTLLVLAGSASAFNAGQKGTKSSFKLADTARPVFSPPDALDGEMPGDFAFDPLNLARNKKLLNFYREAEVRHARLAMLAVVGWPISELLNSKIAANFDLPSVTTQSDLAPGILNGNLFSVSPQFYVAALTVAAMIEGHTLLRKEEPQFIGDIGFDPLNAYPKDPELQRQIQEAEIVNGRLAMLGITGFALAEAVNHVGVVDLTPQFF